MLCTWSLAGQTPCDWTESEHASYQVPLSVPIEGKLCALVTACLISIYIYMLPLLYHGCPMCEYRGYIKSLHIDLEYEEPPLMRASGSISISDETCSALGNTQYSIPHLHYIIYFFFYYLLLFRNSKDNKENSECVIISPYVIVSACETWCHADWISS